MVNSYLVPSDSEGFPHDCIEPLQCQHLSGLVEGEVGHWPSIDSGFGGLPLDTKHEQCVQWRTGVALGWWWWRGQWGEGCRVKKGTKEGEG